MNIAAVAISTGLTKEVIRKWESRYGFPAPERDAVGNRRFTQDHVRRLQMIKTLLDRGMRPGKVVPLSLDDLIALCAQRRDPNMSLAVEITDGLLSATQSTEPGAVRDFLTRQIDGVGLSVFVTCMLPCLAAHVGQAWADGRIGIRNEHVFTESAKMLLRGQIDRVTEPVRRPRILMTTPAGESHTLGLLMAELILRLEGAECIALGANLSVEEIALAAAQYQADVIGLSVSDAFPVRTLTAFLTTLRRRLPAQVTIWAGGAACRHLANRPHGVDLILTFDSAIAGVRAFRASLAEAS